MESLLKESTLLESLSDELYEALKVSLEAKSKDSPLPTFVEGLGLSEQQITLASTM